MLMIPQVDKDKGRKQVELKLCDPLLRRKGCRRLCEKETFTVRAAKKYKAEAVTQAIVWLFTGLGRLAATSQVYRRISFRSLSKW